MYGEDGEWAKKAAASIEVRIETVKGMGNPKGYGSDIFADTFRCGEREKERKEAGNQI